jgi:hypothetical protein
MEGVVIFTCYFLKAVKFSTNIQLISKRKIKFIPIPGNNFIFKRCPCAENRLKKKGLYFSILAPSFLSDFRPLSRCLNMKLFPGIGITWELKI